MILIPEIETVVILVPRTGSGSLRRAVAATYPRSMLLYRHMEADGVPHGYDRWPKVGVIRHPLDRLWSLCKFLKRFDGDYEPAYIQAQRDSVRGTFGEWIVKNETVFTSPYDSSGGGRFFPNYTVRHPLPETKKSQFLYLRPDLGTQMYRYQDVGRLAARLRITLGRTNATDDSPPPPLPEYAREHMQRWFSWDYGCIDALPESEAA